MKQPSISKVDLSSNKIQTLLLDFNDPNFSKFSRAFSSINSVNISDNPLVDVRETTQCLLSLMPGVIDLQISLYDEQDVDFIIRKFKQLKFLNNIPVE